ncbi:MAG: biotin carboxylase N-terminal domain-containing protein [bacterium]
MPADETPLPFDRVLVANRGEIAVRILRTLRRLGIGGVAVYSYADRDAPHVRLADAAVRLGPAPARESYLDIDRVVDSALRSGARAIHPGYGFLSENAAFARACREAGIVFIGPTPEVIDAMGDKIAAKATAIAAGVPVVPGRHDPDMDDDDIADAVREVGFPALLKPAAGGGGKGMRVVREGDDVRAAIAGSRREAAAAFADDRLLVERYVDSPRHIEVQVLADEHGCVIHLGERECSLQRRHQKVIEEAPSPLLDAGLREEICASAVRLARAVGYTSAGTVEYVVPAARPADFAFLEMNPRLQVEPPVTEAVTGIDLVEMQLRVAAGERLPLAQEDVRIDGHAIEARVYAEDPARGSLPTGGTILLWREPESQRQPEGLRVDAGVADGVQVTSYYDPMLAKVIAHAPTRMSAIEALERGLGETVCIGVTTNIDDLRGILRDPRVRAGDLDTSLLDGREPRVPAVSDPVIAAAALALLPAPGETTFDAGDAWRLGGPAPQRWEIEGREVTVCAEGAVPSVDIAAVPSVEIEGSRVAPDVVDAVAVAGGQVWLHDAEGHHRLTAVHPRDRVVRAASTSGPEGRWVARSPMPGAVTDVPVAVGARVEPGDALVVVEAMKMEHTLRAPAASVVARVSVAVGEQVRLDQDLVEVELEPAQGSAS